MSPSQSFLRRIIVGETPPFILSHSQFKRNILVGQLALLTAFMCIFYALFDFVNDITASFGYQIVCFTLALLSFFLNRWRYYRAAKLTLGITVNTVLFVFAASEPHNTGLYAIYIPICLGALAAFGFEEKWWAIALISYSIVLCIASLTLEFQFVPPVPTNLQYVNINYGLNLSISGIASVLILYFLLSVNHHAEAKLLENEQQLLRKNEELTKLNSELDRFVYSSSHDLRAPLSSVLGLINLTELSTSLDETKSFAHLMKQRISDLDKFISKISDYSRNKRTVIEIETVILKKLVRDVLESLRFYPGSDQIEVHLQISDELSVDTDPVRLKMVIANLISNAFKYRDPAKEKSSVIIQAQKQEHGIIVEIADNGIGIPKENLPRIFEMFFQAHDNSVGSGLGLYIVKETIDKLGGEIIVGSTRAVGTTFKISLPLQITKST